MRSISDLNEVRRFSGLEFLARQVVEGFITGLHKSPFHGFSVEFAEHRIYNTGESTRHIDWKLYGRTDRLFVKRYEEETNLRCQLVIDRSPSMFYPGKALNNGLPANKEAFSVYCAAAFTYLLRRQRDAVGLTLFSDKVDLHTPSRSSPVHFKTIFSELDKLLLDFQPGEKKTTSAASSLHAVAEAIHRRSLVLVFSDMLDSQEDSREMFSALQHLKHNGHEVILFHVLDIKHELDFDFGPGIYKFIDMESGEDIKIFPGQVKEKYQEEMKKYCSAIKLRCGQYGIDYVEADINKGFAQVLLPFLVKRAKMV
ncbi:MAG: hypothetical protein RLZZ46_1677 [Bacteroidota bacterium]|jgi:uncharacterized protein (DUF58 family)